MQQHLTPTTEIRGGRCSIGASARGGCSSGLWWPGHVRRCFSRGWGQGARRAGWGGVVAKTVALTSTPVTNVSPRYGKLKSASGDTVGFQNIELISDRTMEEWEDYYKETKDRHPHKILIASIMESYEKARWQEVAGRSDPPWACGPCHST